MKEIKFRAWIPDIKRMHEVLSLELYECDDIVSNPPKVTVWDHCSTRAAKIKGRVATYKRSDIPIMQYTGLKDRNGKEIYEGDILKVEFSKQHRRVVWYSFAWWAAYPDDSHVLNQINNYLPKELEIIGNIYENPNLI